MTIFALRQKRCVLSVLAIALTPLFLSAERASAQSEAASASRFVRDFYAWYTPTGVPERDKPSWRTVLEKKSDLLSSSLRKELAREASQSEPDKLDADPFVNSQDPCERYIVGETKRTRAVYSVEVYAVCNGKKQRRPSLTAELAKKRSSWVFVNFLYPDHSNLLTILRQ